MTRDAQPVAWTDGVSLEWMPGHPKATTDKRTPLYSHHDMAEAIFQRDLARADANEEARNADELVQRFNAMKAEMKHEVAAWRELHDQRQEQMRACMRDAERYRYLRACRDETQGMGVWREEGGYPVHAGWLSDDDLDEAVDAALDKAVEDGKS